MGELADAPTGKGPAALRATPEEIAAVRRSALAHPLLGYKRLAWKLIDVIVVVLVPLMVSLEGKVMHLARRTDLG